MKITLYCQFCQYEDRAEFDVTVPEGWTIHNDTMEEERDAFCAKHADIDLFRQEQCPGCVGGWGDCGMWDAFAYDNASKRNVGEADYAALERGVCPRRTNGTFMVHNTPGEPFDMKPMDLSSPAVVGGRAFAQGIREYVEKYPVKYR